MAVIDSTGNAYYLQQQSQQRLTTIFDIFVQLFGNTGWKELLIIILIIYILIVSLLFIA
jgi:hypothetical protein